MYDSAEVSLRENEIVLDKGVVWMGRGGNCRGERAGTGLKVAVRGLI